MLNLKSSKLVLIGLLGLALAGCGGSGSSNSNAGNPTISAPTTTLALGLQGPNLTIPVSVSGGTANAISLTGLPTGVSASYSSNGTSGCASVKSGGVCNITLTPSSAVQAGNAVLSIGGTNTNTLSLPLSLALPDLVLNPNSVTSPQTTTVTLSNQNGVPAEVTAVSLTDPSGVWHLGGSNNCSSKTLSQNQSCTLTLTASSFTNTQASLTITGSNFPTMNLPISTSINPGNITITAPTDSDSNTNITFNDAAANDKQFTIINNTPFTVPVTYSYSNNFGSHSNFNITATGCTGTAPNLTLATGGTCTLDLVTTVPVGQDLGTQANFNLGVASVNDTYNLIMPGVVSITNTAQDYATYQELTLNNDLPSGDNATDITATIDSSLANVLEIAAPLGVTSANTCSSQPLAPQHSCVIWFHMKSQTIVGNATDASGVTLSWQQSDGTNHSPVPISTNTTTYLYAAGSLPSSIANGIIRWDGQKWIGLASGVSGFIQALAVDPNSGNVVVGGSFQTASGVTVNNIAAWNGTSWEALGAGINGQVESVLVDSQGNIYAGGDLTGSGSTSFNNLGEYTNGNWQALTGFNIPIGSGSDVTNLAEDNSGTLYVGGQFQTFNSVSSKGLVEYKSGTWTDISNSFPSGNSQVYGLAVLNNSLYVTSGNNNLLANDGSGWQTEGTTLNNSIAAISSDSSGNIYVGGAFTGAGSGTNGVAELQGGQFTALGSGLNGVVADILIDGNNDLYAGGWFTQAGGVPAYGVAQWNGSTWQSLGALTSGNNIKIEALALGSQLTLTPPQN